MKKNKKITKQDKAITLIALVVTIIILLILAGVTVGLATNGTGLYDKAKLATDEYNNSVDKEETELAKATNEIDSHIDGNRENSIPKWKYLGQTSGDDNSIVLPENFEEIQVKVLLETGYVESNSFSKLFLEDSQGQIIRDGYGLTGSRYQFYQFSYDTATRKLYGLGSYAANVSVTPQVKVWYK